MRVSRRGTVIGKNHLALLKGDWSGFVFEVHTGTWVIGKKDESGDWWAHSNGQASLVSEVQLHIHLHTQMQAEINFHWSNEKDLYDTFTAIHRDLNNAGVEGLEATSPFGVLERVRKLIACWGEANPL